MEEQKKSVIQEINSGNVLFWYVIAVAHNAVQTDSLTESVGFLQ